MNKKVFFYFIIFFISILALELTSFFVFKFFHNREIPACTLDLNKYGNTNGLKSNLDTCVWGKKFSTDHIGSRPSTNWTKKTKKIWIGDSVLEGLGVNDSELFTFTTQKNDTIFQHLNLAHAGNTTLDYLNIVKSITDTLDNSFIMDVKCISIVYCLNDIYTITHQNIHSVKPALLQFVANFLRKFYTYRLVRLWLFNNSDFYFRYDSALYQEEENLKRVENHFFEIRKICERQDITLNVFLMPYKSQFESLNFKPQQILSKRLDLLSISNTVVDERYLSVHQIDHYYLLSDEIHFSAEGHKALAEIFMKF